MDEHTCVDCLAMFLKTLAEGKVQQHFSTSCVLISFKTLVPRESNKDRNATRSNGQQVSHLC